MQELQRPAAAAAMQDKARDAIKNNSLLMIDQGMQTFRFDTFGDEAFWGDTLKLHQAIQGSRFGGVGAGVSPKTALAVGLKVDVDALPHRLVAQLKNATLNLDDPANTLALIKLNAVLELLDVVNHYNNNLPGGPLGLSDGEKNDLVEYLYSL